MTSRLAWLRTFVTTTVTVLIMTGSAAAQQGVLLMQSEPGDYIGQGEVATYSSPTATFAVTNWSANTVHIRVDGPTFLWWLTFAAPETEPLVAGYYGSAVRNGSTPFASLSISGNGRGCNTLTGRFLVRDIQYGSGGSIQSLAIDAEQHCGDATPALFVALRYNSSVSLDTFPGSTSRFSLEVTPSSGGLVTGAGLTCGAGNEVCTASFESAASVTLTATPESGYVFTGWSGDCLGAPTTTLNLNSVKRCAASFAISGSNATVLMLRSEEGDYIGGGLTQFYNTENSRLKMSRGQSSIAMTVRGAEFNWWLNFGAPDDGPLTPGYYPTVVGSSGSSYPILEVSGNSRGCNRITGRFLVHEIQYGDDGSVLRLAIDLEQHCEDQPPALFGALRYNSAVPLDVFPGDTARYALTLIPPSHGVISGSGLACGGGSSACETTFASAATVTLTAIPDPGYLFMSWTGDCFGAATTTLNVNSVKRCGALFEKPGEPMTVLVAQSDPGDWIGRGISAPYAPPTVAFDIRRNHRNGVSVSISGPATRWSLEFSAPGDQPLAPGPYLAATRFPFTRFVGMAISHDASGCNTLTGRYLVREIEYGSTGDVVRLAIDAEQHCEDHPAALFVALRFNSTVPPDIFPDSPARYSLAVEPPAHGLVTGGGLACGGSERACSAAYPVPTQVTLTATPADGYIFAGWTGGCLGGPTTSVNVNTVKQCTAMFAPAIPNSPRTLLSWQSTPGDWIGAGRTEVFNTENSVWRTETGSSGAVTFYLTTTTGSSWSLWFSVPGSQPGRYLDARRLGSPGIDIGGDGRSCDAIGSFTVHQMDRDPATGAIISFAVDFEQHCQVATAPPLIGTLLYKTMYAPGSAPPPNGGTTPTSPTSPPPSASGCVTPDPFAAMGGGTCHNGGWLPPGMSPPEGNDSEPPPPPPPPPSSSTTCTSPDPFASMGGGTCYDGGWLPPGMTPPGGSSTTPSLPPPSDPQPPSSTPPPPSTTGCSTPDPFVSMGGGTCFNGGWLPPGMAPPSGGSTTPTPVPPPSTTPTGCTTPDPFVSLGGGTCRNGGWLPPGMK